MSICFCAGSLREIHRKRNATRRMLAASDVKQADAWNWEPPRFKEG